MKQIDITTSQVIASADALAYEHQLHTAEKMVGLQAAKNYLNAGPFPGGIEQPGLLGNFALEVIQNTPIPELRITTLHMDFYIQLAQWLRVLGDKLGKPEELQASIDRAFDFFHAHLHPKAHDLLAALYRQSNITYRKVETEKKQKILLDKGGSVLFPESYGSSLDSFYSTHYENLKKQIPEGQSAIDFYILDRIKFRFTRLFAKHLQRCYNPTLPTLPDRVFFGTLELSDPYAQTEPVEDEYLVILSRSLWIATALASAVAALRVSFSPAFIDPVGFDSAVSDADFPYICHIRDILHGEFPDFSYPPITDVRRMLYWEIIDSLEKGFLFGHEYAHFLRGHFATGASDGINSEDLNWRYEYEADWTALDLIYYDQSERMASLLQLTKDSFEELPADVQEALQARMVALKVAFCATGALLVLHLIHRMEQLRSLYASTASPHPPTILRIRAIWKILRKHIPDQNVFNDIRRSIDIVINGFLQLLDNVSGFSLDWRVRFEDAAFLLLFNFDYDTVLDALEQLKKEDIQSRTGSSSSSYLAHLRTIYEENGTAGEIQSFEKHAVIQSCIDVLKKNRKSDLFAIAG